MSTPDLLGQRGWCSGDIGVCFIVDTVETEAEEFQEVILVTLEVG